MRKTIKRNSAEYLKKYELVPEFKAGVHYGTVTAGEIGIIKRDITFSGDVLNTAAALRHMGVKIEKNDDTDKKRYKKKVDIFLFSLLRFVLYLLI